MSISNIGGKPANFDIITINTNVNKSGDIQKNITIDLGAASVLERQPNGKVDIGSALKTIRNAVPELEKVNLVAIKTADNSITFSAKYVENSETTRSDDANYKQQNSEIQDSVVSTTTTIDANSGKKLSTSVQVDLEKLKNDGDITYKEKLTNIIDNLSKDNPSLKHTLDKLEVNNDNHQSNEPSVKSFNTKQINPQNTETPNEKSSVSGADNVTIKQDNYQSKQEINTEQSVKTSDLGEIVSEKSKEKSADSLPEKISSLKNSLDNLKDDSLTGALVNKESLKQELTEVENEYKTSSTSGDRKQTLLYKKVVRDVKSNIAILDKIESALVNIDALKENLNNSIDKGESISNIDESLKNLSLNISDVDSNITRSSWQPSENIIDESVYQVQNKANVIVEIQTKIENNQNLLINYRQSIDNIEGSDAAGITSEKRESIFQSVGEIKNDSKTLIDLGAPLKYVDTNTNSIDNLLSEIEKLPIVNNAKNIDATDVKDLQNSLQSISLKTSSIPEKFSINQANVFTKVLKSEVEKIEQNGPNILEVVNDDGLSRSYENALKSSDRFIEDLNGAQEIIGKVKNLQTAIKEGNIHDISDTLQKLGDFSDINQYASERDSSPWIKDFPKPDEVKSAIDQASVVANFTKAIDKLDAQLVKQENSSENIAPSLIRDQLKSDLNDIKTLVDDIKNNGIEYKESSGTSIQELEKRVYNATTQFHKQVESEVDSEGASEGASEVVSDSKSIDKTTHFKNTSDVGIQYGFSSNKEEAYLLDVAAIREQGKDSIELNFRPDPLRNVSFNVDLSNIDTDIVLKVSVDPKAITAEESIKVEIGETKKSTWKSRNPIKTFKNLTDKSNNNRLRFVKTNSNSLGVKDGVIENISIDQHRVKSEDIKGLQVTSKDIKEDFTAFHAPMHFSGTSVASFYLADTNILNQNGNNIINSILDHPGTQLLSRLLPSLDIFFTNQKNPEDSSWAEKYNNNEKSFESFGTAGSSDITFYNSDKNIAKFVDDGDLSFLLYSFNHEAGHVLANQIYGNVDPPKNSLYMAAIKADGGIGTHYTDYGNNAICEDFAESVSFFLHSDPVKKEEFRNKNPNRYKAIEAIIAGEGDYKYIKPLLTQLKNAYETR